MGKQFHYIPGECAFDETSAAVMSYLTEIYEIQETLGKTYYSNLFNRQELVLSKNMLLKLLHLAEGLECELTLFGKTYDQVEIISDNPEVSMDMEMKEDVLCIKNGGDSKMISMTDDGSILFYNDVIYLPKQEYICNLLPFCCFLLA